MPYWVSEANVHNLQHFCGTTEEREKEMKRRICGVLTVIVLLSVILSGCGGARDDIVISGNTSPGTTVDPGTNETDTPSAAVLTDNLSITGGVKSSFLQEKGIDFVPTARAEKTDTHVRTSKSMVSYDESAAKRLVNVYAYNEAGQQISSGTNAGIYETFDYDEAGRLIQHLNDGDLYIYNYGEDGLVQSAEHYDAEYYPSGWRGRLVYSYEGDTVRESYYRGDDETLEYYTVYAGDKILEYRYSGQYTEDWDFYEYDENGNLKYMLTALDGEKKIQREYIYDECGVLTQSVAYENGEPTGTNLVYIYDESGNCICVELGYYDIDADAWLVNGRIELTYDETGNLIAEHAFNEEGESLTGYYIEYTYELVQTQN